MHGENFCHSRPLNRISSVFLTFSKSSSCHCTGSFFTQSFSVFSFVLNNISKSYIILIVLRWEVAPHRSKDYRCRCRARWTGPKRDQKWSFLLERFTPHVCGENCESGVTGRCCTFQSTPLREGRQQNYLIKRCFWQIIFNY